MRCETSQALRRQSFLSRGGFTLWLTCCLVLLNVAPGAAQDEADLIVTQVTDTETAAAGTELVYTITVSNNGPADATGVLVTDTLPSGTTFVASEGCIEDPSAHPDCGLGTLPAGAMSSFSLTVAVPSDAFGLLTNVAEADAATSDPNPGNNDVALVTGVSIESDLGILISDAPDPVVASGTITYNIEVINNGPSDATGVQVTDALPEGVVISSTNGCDEDPNASPTCTLGDLAAGDSVMYTLEARVDPSTVGTLENTVNVSSLALDGNDANNAALQTTTAFAEADLDVSMIAEPDTVVAGEELIYTIFVENNGPSNATLVTANLLLPPEVTLVSTSGCLEGPMALPTCSLGDLVVGATTFYQATVSVAPSAAGVITSQVFVSNTATDPDSGNNDVSFDATVISEADLSVSKTDETLTAVPGGTLGYTIEVRNDGPSDASDVDVIDPFPANLDCIWQCAPGEGATCSSGQVAADLIDTIYLPAGGSVVYTAACGIDPSATGTLANTVRISYPGIDPDLLDNVASDLDTVLEGRADLRLNKTDGITLTAPGQIVTYTLQVLNDGPSDALSSVVSDTFSDLLEDITWTCSASGASSCTSSGVGNIADTVNLLAGDQLTYIANGRVVDNAEGHLVNTARVDIAEGLTDPNPNNNSDTDFDTEITDIQADLRISKSDGVLSAVPGTSLTYTLIVTNEGPHAVDDARVQDTFPADLSCIWSCLPSEGGSCTPGQVAGDIDHLADLPASGTVTYTAVCAIAADASGTLSNTATVSVPSGVLDPDLIDNSASDLDTVLGGRSDLRILKTDGTTLTAPGQSLTYTLRVFNDGPSDVSGARIQDEFSTEIENVTWTCSATGTSTCSAAGVGNIDDLAVLRVGDQLTYLATGTVASNAAGTLLNSATVTVPDGVSDPDGSNNTAVDFDTVVTDVLADLSISKTDNLTQATPGETITYILEVSNSGPNAVLGALVQDTFPSELTCIWSCVGSAGGQCAAGQVAGDISQPVNLPVSGVATFSAECVIDPSASGTLSNTASVTPPAAAVDPNPLDNSASDLDTVLSGLADLTISKTDNLTVTSPGEEITYQITVRNDGPSDVLGAQVNDSFPTDLEDVSWICIAGGGASCSAGGVDQIAESVDLPAGASLVYLATATVSDGATGNLENTATATPPESVIDPDLNNNTAIDFDTALSDVRADLSISKTDLVTSALPGGSVEYRIVVSNAGPAEVTGARVGDVFPTTLTCLWSCTTEGGAQCTAGQVAGNIDHLVNLPVASSVTYVAQCAIDSAAAGTLANTATLSVPSEVFDPNLLNNSASDLDTVLQSPQVDLSLTLDADGRNAVTGQAIPGDRITYTLEARNDAALFALVDGDEGAEIWQLDLGHGGGRLVRELSQRGCTALRIDAAGEPEALCDVETLTALDDTILDNAKHLNLSHLAVSALHPTRAEGWAILLEDRSPTLVRLAPQTTEPESSGSSVDPLKVTSIGPTLANIVALAFGPPPQNLAGILVQDDFPAVLACQWTCTASLGSSCTAGPVLGDIQDTVQLASGGRLTYTAQCDIDSAAVSLLGSSELTNSATLSTPAGVVDADLDNNTAVQSTLLSPRGDLRITKSDGRSSIASGESLTYTIQVSNPGPSDVNGAVVEDDFSTLPLSQVFWTCTASVGSVCSAAGVSVLADSVHITAGGTLTFLATGTVLGDASGTLINQATVSIPEGFSDPILNNNTALDFDTTISPRADLAISKSDGVTSGVPGESLTYVLAVANGGPSDAFGATVRDVFPSQLDDITWTCQATPGSSCNPTGSGHLNESVDLLAGGLLTFSATATIQADAVGTLSNTATVSAPFGIVDPNLNDNSASDFDTQLTPRVDLAIQKSDQVTSATPGGMVTYVITASNDGPSAAVGATVDDGFADIFDCLWTCSGSNDGVCTPGQASGDIHDTVDLPVAASVTYIANCQIDSAATGQLTNTASVAPGPGTVEIRLGDNTSSDLDTVLSAEADLAVSKTDGLTTASPGETLTYTVVVSNLGPSDVQGAEVTDPMPSVLDNILWSCVSQGGGSCVSAGAGDLAEFVDLPAGSQVTFTVQGEIRPDATGTLSNTASVTLPSGVVDPLEANNSATDDDTVLVPTADLAIHKTDSLSIATPGGQVTYTLEVTNDGPSDIVGAVVADTFADELICTWFCVGESGALCAPGPVQGSINDPVTLPVAGRAIYTALCDIASGASGTLANTATVTVPDGSLDPILSNNSSSDLDTVLQPVADLRLSKTDSQTSAIPGEMIVYTIEVANEGPSDVQGAQVADLFPSDLDCSWSCLGSAGATCTAGPISGNLVDAVDLPAASSATFTATCAIDSQATGILSNTASITPPIGIVDPNLSDNTATDGDTVLSLSADLSISLSDGVEVATPGESVTYTLVVGNAGPNGVQDARVQDLFPDSLSCFWGCVATGGGQCTPGQVNGDLLDTLDLPAASSATYTVECQIDATATGTLSNTATVLLPDGASDPSPSNNSASDLDTVLSPRADLRISKTDGALEATPGDSVTYTLVVNNPDGPSAIEAAAVSDVFPAGLACSWTCDGSQGGVCTPGPIVGDLIDAVSLPPGGRATYQAQCGIDPLATGTLSNTASVNLPNGSSDPDLTNNSATDDDTVLIPQVDLVVSVDNGQNAAIPGTEVVYHLSASNEPPLFALVETSQGSIQLLRWSVSVQEFQVLETLPLSACEGLTQGNDGLLRTRCVDGLSPPQNYVLWTENDRVNLRPEPDPALQIALRETPLDFPTTGLDGRLVGWTSAEVANVQGAQVAADVGSLAQCVWTCSASGDASCTAGPISGPLADTVNLGVGSQVDYTLSCQISPAAGGTLVVAAEIVPPQGVVEVDPSNNVDSDVDALIPTADLAVSKSDGVATAIPGASVTYTVVGSNPEGPSDIVGATMSDLFTSSLSCVWTCVGTDGGQCTPGQEAGDIVDTVDLPVGARVTFSAVCQIDPDTQGSLTNTVQLSLPAGSVDPNVGNNSASDLDTVLTPTADLAITKSDGLTSAAPGDTVTYAIVVSHLGGASHFRDVLVEDHFSSQLDCLWTCQAQGGASCRAGQQAGDIVDLVDLPRGSQIEYEAQCEVAADASGQLLNTATLTVPVGSEDSDASNNSATDSNTMLQPRADLRIEKSNGSDTVSPGQPVVYSIVVANDGPSSVSGALVEDDLPNQLEDCQWTCQAAAGSSCTAGPVLGDLVDTVQLAAGSLVSYEVACIVSEDAIGQVLNTATVTAPAELLDNNLNNNTSTDLDSVFVLHADLVLTKTDGVTSATPGGSVTYTLQASNPNGPSGIVEARVFDTPPDTLSCSWSCSADAGASCDPQAPDGDLEAFVDLPVGSSATFVGHCQIDSEATGSLSNTAQLVLPVGGSDPDEANNVATDSDTQLLASANLVVVKTDGREFAGPGQTTDYTIEITNPGPSALTSATVNDPFPPELTCTWSCTSANGGANCQTTAQTGNLLDTVDLPVGSFLRYAAQCLIDSEASGTLNNTVTITSQAGVHSAQDQTLLVPSADLVISKSDGVDVAVPGLNVTYVIQVQNPAGPSTQHNALVQDNFPNLTQCSWSCAAENGSSCGTTSGTDDLLDLATVAVGGQVTYIASCAIADGATGSLINTATVTVADGSADPDLSNNSATDIDHLSRSHDLILSMSGDPAEVYPGQELHYTLNVFNSGPSDAGSITLVDQLPDGIEYLSATVSGFTTSSSVGVLFRDGFESGNMSAWGNDGGGGGGAPEAPCQETGGTISCSLGSLGSSNTGTVQLRTRVAVGTVTGTVINSATLSSAGSDPDSSNDTATSTTLIRSSDTDLGISVADSPDPVVAGDDLYYTLVVTNHGPAAASGVVAVDNLPPDVTLVSATPSTGSCGNDVGVVTCQLGELDIGASVEISLWVLVNAETTSALTNPATVDAEQVDPNPVNDVDFETTTVLPGDSFGQPDSKGTVEPIEIPTISEWGLIFLAILLAGLGTNFLRRRQGRWIG